MDPGLSNERTALAWQRTALSVLAGAAIMGRLTFDRLGVVALIVPGIAAFLGLWVFVESRWRYDQHFDRRVRRRPRGGRAGLSLTVGTAMIAITQLMALEPPPAQ